MDGIPANHRLAERELIKLVREGEWAVYQDGSIWRHKVRHGLRYSGMSQLTHCRPRRIEKRMPTGYLMVRAMRDHKRVVGLAHRLVWQHFYGDIPPGMTVNHKNGLKDDNRPENLELSTPSEQAKHSHRSGLRDQHGQRNPAAKLSDNQVAQIRLAYDQGGHDMRALADRFSVSFQAVSKIVRGQRRRKQGGPIADSDQRHAGPRDPATGKFISKARAGRLLDGREHSECPA